MRQPRIVAVPARLAGGVDRRRAQAAGIGPEPEQ